MVINQEYKKIYTSFLRLKKRHHNLKIEILDYEKETTQLFLKRMKSFKRLKENKNLTYDNLFTKLKRTEFKPHLDKHDSMVNRLKKLDTKIDNYEQKLYELAVKIESDISRKMTIAKTSNSGQYWSMGLGATRYAKESLKPLQNRLESLNSKADIIKHNTHDARNYKGRYIGMSSDFSLITNQKKYVIDACKRSIGIENIKAMNDSTNLKAMYPLWHGETLVSELDSYILSKSK